MGSQFVQVALPVPVFRTYEYEIPSGMEAEPGVRVLVQYGSRQLSGIVVEISDQSGRAGETRARSVLQVLDASPVIGAELLEVILQAAVETLCPPGIALQAAVPPGTAPRPGRRVRLMEAGRRALERGEAKGTLGQVLWSLGKNDLAEQTLKRRFPAAVPMLSRLQKLGWIRIESTTESPRVSVKTERFYFIPDSVDPEAARTELKRSPKRLEIFEDLQIQSQPLAATDPLRALVRKGLVQFEDREVCRNVVDAAIDQASAEFQLTPHQHEAVQEIVEAVNASHDRTFLLYGITGSGKTEVYLRAANETLKRGRGLIVLVPEISLTHQLVDRFRERFGERVAVLHSGLSDGERFDQWRGIRAGEYPIVIGARSAIFAPLDDLGMIVIDEEHDGAYKSEEGFRYHARDLAMLRARVARCPLILGSATPDVETAYRSQTGEIERLTLPERVEKRPLPKVEIVDMEKEPMRRGRRPLLSRALRHAMASTLTAGRQIILFLNRRGFATSVYCFSCGYAIRCKHCDITLVYHATTKGENHENPNQGELRCHYCGYVEEPSPRCPNCKSPEGGLSGFGTERLQEEVESLYPHARVGRLDRDTSSRKGEQRRILGSFHRGDLDILVGTQMVAKGHDIPGVTLVGVVCADLGMHFPDFRAGERTFQLLTQVAGRAGRGVDPGQVVIQTFLPDHYAIALAKTHDYPSFYREELKRRRTHGYPPFRWIGQLQISGADPDAVEAAAHQLAARAETVPLGDVDQQAIEILGPAPAPLARIRDVYRWQLLVLGERRQILSVLSVLRDERNVASGIKLRVDPRPLQML